jgi:hypothetical protein
MFDIIECRVPELPVRSHIEWGEEVRDWSPPPMRQGIARTHAHTHVARPASAQNISRVRLAETEN